MANRNNVYIGNRYVPVFADPVEWDNLRIYEPLTIVTYQGTSYTSKKAVPAGIALSNTEYWVATGNYNAQVEQYRQDVVQYAAEVSEVSEQMEDISGRMTSAEGNINTLNTKVNKLDIVSGVDDIILMMSDSYGSTYGNDPGDTNTFFDYVRANLGRTTANFKTRALSGVGFLKAYDNKVFKDYFDLWIANLTAAEKAKVSKLYVVAGRNDYEYTTDQIMNAITAFVNNAKNQLPNVRVYLMFVANGSAIGNGTKAEQKNVFYAYQRCAKCGAIYIPGGEAILRDSSLMNSDHIHPNSNGQKMLGIYVTEAVLNGSCSVSYINVQTPLERIPSGVSINLSFRSRMDDNKVTINLGSVGGVSFTSAQTASSSYDKVIGYLDGTRRFFVPEATVYLPASISFYNGTTHVNATGCLYIDSDMSIHLKAYAPAGVNFDNIAVIATGIVSLPAIEM